MSNSYFLSFLGLILGFFISTGAQARLHEVQLQTTDGIIQFAQDTTANFEGNYLYQIDETWQAFVGAQFERINDDTSRMGLSLGANYNFGATDHNEKYYVKPQINFTYFNNYYGSDTVTFLSVIFGKRIPIFAGDRYTINYTPSVGLSQPLNNTYEYDLVLTFSIIGLSLVF